MKVRPITYICATVMCLCTITPICFDGKVDMMYFCQQFKKQNYIIRIISHFVICFTGNIDVWLSPLALVPLVLNEK